ncbi:MAG: alpha/beta fold hydrolase [Candidatus Bathyarchaeota archaeon]|nr:MAG: alpha/beta fold hydrolase [Candidatus Bathyarchaeota archaeon]
MSDRKDLLAAVFFAFLIASGIWLAHQLNTDNGRLKVETISFVSGDRTLSGLIYTPPEAHPDNPRPAVVLSHGISSTKETVSGIALELARRGVISLTIDLLGHGDSEGRLNSADPTIGMLAAVNHLRSLPYVDTGSIGVAGHSLGAGAARATAFSMDAPASALIGGGVSESTAYQQEGVMNSTHPRNILIAVGSHDILFNIEALREELKPIFRSSEPVEPGVTYGDMESGLARRLVVTPTIHLLEPLVPVIVQEVVDWFLKAFDVPSGRELPLDNITYIMREAAILLALAAMIGLVFPLSRLMQTYFGDHEERSKGGVRRKPLSGLRVLIIWGGLGLGLFLPFMGLGVLLPFPPQLFGSSMAWWLLSIGAAGTLIIWFVSSRDAYSKFSMKRLISASFKKSDALLASALIVFLYLTSVAVEKMLSINLRIFVPILNSLEPASRVATFPAYIPFFFVFFFVEGLYLFELRRGASSDFSDLVKVIVIKLLPYLAVLSVQYAPMYLLGMRLIPGFLGFFVEFIWAIVPLFAISTATSWWFRRITGRIGQGVVFNVLLMAWVSASLFPYGTFG